MSRLKSNPGDPSCASVLTLSKHHLRQPPPVNLSDTRISHLHIALNKSRRPRHTSPSAMDFVKNLAGGNKDGEQQQTQQQGEQKSEGGFMSKLNNMAGGGAAGEKKEDGLDKGVDWVQENVLGQGKQDNESAVEQAKDEQISDFIRGQYKNTSGKDFPIADK
ncbi:hypothetical protein FJTKL_11717 [Diaporthe vaccinii]|uniref:Uncharacterized protein n=2 Tax=Diaporthe eres species complex TaxID=2972384 RepID=A0ABR4EFR7_9PEZI